MSIRAKSYGKRALADALEPRVLLSTNPSSAGTRGDTLEAELTSQIYAQPLDIHMDPLGAGSASPAGLTAPQMRGAYGLGQYRASPITFGASHVQADGSGQTVGIVVAYNYPTALTDLHTFDTQFSLPDPPSFMVVNQDGAASPLPGTDPNATANSSWEAEAALDIQSVHMMAPKANIVLVEANSPGLADLMAGVDAATGFAGVSVVSMSFAAPEFGIENTLDYHFTTPPGHTGITFVAGSGDVGSVTTYPNASQNVLSVGRTSLNVNGNAYASESAWSGSGGGYSSYVYQPSYQAGHVTPYISGQRTTPDVAMYAAGGGPDLQICDSFDLGAATPWAGAEGTSAGGPLWAGILAVVNQGRLINGLSQFDGPSQILPVIYQMDSQNLRDITTGSTGLYSAQSGYDLTTGLGSPIANLLIPTLAGTTPTTTPKPDLEPVYYNNSLAPLSLSTSTSGNSEPTMITPGTEVYLNYIYINSGAADVPNTTISNHLTRIVNGALSNITTSTYTGPLVTGDYVYLNNYDVGSISSGINEYKMQIDSTNAVAESTETNNTYERAYILQSVPSFFTVKLDSTGTIIQVLKGGVIYYQMFKSQLQNLSFYLGGAPSSATFTIDLSNGNPIPMSGLSVNVDPNSNLPLIITGAPGNDSLSINGTQMMLDGSPISYSGLSSITFNGGAGNSVLTQSAAPASPLTVNVNSGESVTFNSSQNLAALNLTGGAATLADNGARALVLGTISASAGGTLDLTNNALVLNGMTSSAVGALLASGYANGAWTGAGINSSFIPQNPGRTIAYGAASTVFSTFPKTFFGESITSGAPILAAYTVSGDANLDLHVNMLDFMKLSASFNQSNTSSTQGNFNFDNKTNALDFNSLATNFGKAIVSGAVPDDLQVSQAMPAETTVADLFSAEPIVPGRRETVDLLRS